MPGAAAPRPSEAGSSPGNMEFYETPAGTRSGRSQTSKQYCRMIAVSFTSVVDIDYFTFGPLIKHVLGMKDSRP